jgi:hypothetical protein
MAMFILAGGVVIATELLAAAQHPEGVLALLGVWLVYLSTYPLVAGRLAASFCPIWL